MKFDLFKFKTELKEQQNFLIIMERVLETELKPELDAIARLIRFIDSMTKLYEHTQIEVNA